MNTSIVGRHIKLTDAIKDYIHSSIKTFEKYNLDKIKFKELVKYVLFNMLTSFLLMGANYYENYFRK